MGAPSIDIGVTGGMGSFYEQGRTYVNMGNPANATGLITQATIHTNGICANCEIGIFSAVGNSLTTRSTHSVGALADGANGITSLNLEIRTGDYIGVYYTAGAGIGIEAEESGGSGLWYSAGDQIPCSGRTFDVLDADAKISVSAAGFQLGSINIGDSWKVIQNIEINIGDSWKRVTYGSAVNIGDAWKSFFY